MNCLLFALEIFLVAAAIAVVPGQPELLICRMRISRDGERSEFAPSKGAENPAHKRMIGSNGVGLHGRTGHVGPCTSVACGPLGLWRIWTVSRDRLDHPGHRLPGRYHLARRRRATSDPSLGFVRADIDRALGTELTGYQEA